DSFLYFNVPLYIGIWLFAVFLSGGYDDQGQIRRLIRGLLVGTLLLAAVYGFLDLAYRPSRALILLGAVWAMMSTAMWRFLLHFVRYGNFNVGRHRHKNLVIVGAIEESERVMGLLRQAEVHKNLIGTVAPVGKEDPRTYLSDLRQLDEVVQIYKVDELIFCSKDISSQDIMRWMSRLGSSIEYKIVPKESMSIIGSSSKNTAGELYTIDIRFNISQPTTRRNKRFLDLIVALCLLLTYPLSLWWVKNKIGLLRNSIRVFLGQKTWVGYVPVEGQLTNLPKINSAILSPLDAFQLGHVNAPTRQRLNFLYAKDYDTNQDLDILWKGRFYLGREDHPVSPITKSQPERMKQKDQIHPKSG
ncbi:MAG: glycosyl transferase family 2, partial [Bacteroidota bacterium]